MASLSAAVDDPQAASLASMVALQQRYGNRAVRRLLQRELTDAPAPTRDLNSPNGLWKHLALLYHPDKAKDPGEIPWRSQMMTRINGARGNLVALKRLQAEGAEHDNATTTTAEPSTTTPIVEPSNALVLVPTGEEGGLNTTVQNVAQNVAPESVQTLVTTNEEGSPEGETEPETAEPAARRTTLKMQSLGHDQEAVPLLKKFMADRNASRNFNFYFDASGDRNVYRKYIADGAAQQVLLPPALKGELDQLAGEKKWEQLAELMNEARAENQAIINREHLPDFEVSPAYQRIAKPVKSPSLFRRVAGAFASGAALTRERLGSQPARQMAMTRRSVELLGRAIDRYSPFFIQGQQLVDQVGLPSNPRDVERMFKAGRERHARVVAAFTRRYAADTNFRKEQYGPFFAKLQTFTRLWVQYKTRLNR